MKPKSTPEVISMLNGMLASERAKHTQFVIHETKLKSFGFPKEMIEMLEMFYMEQHMQIDELVKRIIFLGGEPAVDTNPEYITVGNTAGDILVNDEIAVNYGIAECVDGITVANKNKDYGTAMMLTHFLKNYEKFLYELEVMLNEEM